MTYVKKFRDTNLADIESVGGKNSSLGEMIQSLGTRKINKEKTVLELLMKAIKNAGYEPGKDISLSLDVAASSVYKDGKYYLGGQQYTSDDLILFYQKLIKTFPIVSIEDGLAEDDWSGWKKLQKEMGDKITLIGDDIFVTNTSLIKKGIDEKAANAVLIKPNQIGTLTSTMEAIDMARKNNWEWVVSHRSGETLDTTIADIAFATGSYGLKTGSPHQRPGLKDDEDVRRIKYKRMAFLENHEECMKNKEPVGLIVLDGWGVKNSVEGNAIKLANTPNYDFLVQNYPNTCIAASGVDVGLPEGEMGNSEVGHLNIGAGRVVEQEVLKINKEIKSGAFYKNKSLLAAFNHAKKHKSKVHVIGLVSNAVVHSSMDHLMALIEMALKNNFKDLCVHIVTDGRDSSPLSARTWIEKVEEKLHKTGVGKIVSVCGRYYAMDRDTNWDRTERAYRLYTSADGIVERDWESALQNSYDKNITDEFVLPTVILDDNGKSTVVKDKDVIVFFNFRADRTRQLTRAFMDKDFEHFETSSYKNLKYVCLTQYDEKFDHYQNLLVAYRPTVIKNTLGEVLSNNNISQLRISETEKYAHVTFFLNGGVETMFSKEERILVDSPKEVATYDLKPEMSSQMLTEKTLLKMSEVDFFVLNFPNPDMVGHTGNLDAAIKAIETIDEKLGLIYQKAKELGYTLIVTADHGNAEEMNKNDLDKLTSHSVNPVPFILIDTYNKMKGVELRSGGRLADIAPTILDIFGIKKPSEMTGRSLIAKTNIYNKTPAINTWIKSIQSEEILDSRGKPTIKTRIILNNNVIGPWAMVPAGKSTGKGEAPVVATAEALQNTKEIEKVLIQKGFTVFDQVKADQLMMDNLEKWGGNTTLAVSLALAKAAAMIKGMELYEYLRYVYPKTTSSKKVRLLMNVFNGGLHALCDKEELGVDKVSTQEFMINILADNYNQAIKMADDVYNSLSEILFNLGYDNKSFGDEGGYSPKVVSGIRVPEGFSVTADAYFYFLKETGIWDEIVSSIGALDVNDIPNLRATSQKLRKLIASSKMPKDLEEEIEQNYRWLSELYKTKNVSVAVRSSATAEDLDDASFAGQHESYLNVVGIKELFKIIKECFASLFTERALVYRNNLGVDHLKVALSVGVQKMVRSDKACAGVMFSCDTESGFADVVLINSSYGLGENIVKGRVETDEFFVFEKTMSKGCRPIVEKRLGAKEWTLIYGEKESGVKNLPTPSEKRKLFSLTDDEVLELAKYSLIIENHYNKPMDIEWAKDGVDGKLYIVQARPETIQSRKDVDILKEYKIKNAGKKVLVEGMAVGSKIGQGKVKIIKNIKDMEKFKKGDVLVTYMTDPDWVPIMKIASAIVTQSGSKTCHSAIVGRELGIPTIVAADKATTKLKEGSEVTVSCAEGQIGKIYDGKIEYEIKETNIKNLRKPPVKITLNVGDPNSVFVNSFVPNEGVGLAREEFIVANFIKIHPSALINYKKQSPATKKQIDELTFGYKNKVDFYVDKLSQGIGKICAAFYPKEVILRFSDFKTNEYRNLIGGEMYEPKEENPMIGWRGASRYYHPDFIEAFKLELKAVDKVVKEFGLDNLSLMVPFCRTVEEGKKVKEIINQHCQSKCKIYVMCEIPSNVILADKFLDVFDGMSIGSNDLTQLVLGLDRDGGSLIASIGNENNEAVKQMVKNVIKTCKERGKYIGICGQAPSDYPEFAKFLIQNKIDSMSLNPDSVLKIIQELNK